MAGQARLMRCGAVLLAGALSVLIACVAGTRVAAADAASQVDWAKAETVTVVAVEYEFKPKHLVFHRGTPYRLHLEDHGDEMHELTAPEFFHSALVKNPEVLARDGTDLVVQPHESRDVLFVPEKAGHFDFVCADHDWAGMTGDITVD